MTNGNRRELERRLVVERRLRYSERRCAVCGKTFLGWGRARFCSPTCRRRSDYAQHAEQRRAHRRETYRRKKQEAEQ
jgi:hypothetical protein